MSPSFSFTYYPLHCKLQNAHVRVIAYHIVGKARESIDCGIVMLHVCLFICLLFSFIDISTDSLAQGSNHCWMQVILGLGSRRC